MKQKNAMTALQRVMTALEHKEPDRVPFLLPASLCMAKELGISIQEYFSKAEYVVEGQLRLGAKYRHDLVSGIFYGAIDYEAWGGEVIYYDDGPPNSGEPFIHTPEDILSLKPPSVKDTRCLHKVLEAISLLKSKVGAEMPIVGVVISPFSLPVMQMGFAQYLNLMYERPKLFDRLMRVNEMFCIEWANAQIDAGATALGYYDPVSSPGMIPRERYLRTGFEVARRTLPHIRSGTVTHLASGRALPIVDDIAQTGTTVVGISVDDDLAEVKARCQGRLAVMGNLNTIAMRRWTAKEAEAAVKEAIAKAGPGGGYILSDNHGEIPYQVPEDVLLTISETVHTWGHYPLDWIEKHDS